MHQNIFGCGSVYVVTSGRCCLSEWTRALTSPKKTNSKKKFLKEIN